MAVAREREDALRLREEALLVVVRRAPVARRVVPARRVVAARRVPVLLRAAVFRAGRRLDELPLEDPVVLFTACVRLFRAFLKWL